MIIGTVTNVPSPVSVQVNGHYIGVTQATPNGMIMCRRKRYPVSGAAYYQQRHLIRLSFADLTPGEYTVIESAYAELIADYVVLSGISGLKIDMKTPLGGVTVDACYVTLAPGTRLSVQPIEGWTLSGGTWQGPLLYNVELSLITGDEQVMYGN